MNINTETLLAILGMALVTYLTRAGGIWLMGRFQPGPHVQAFLRNIPGAVLISIVAPAAFSQGPAEIIAAALTVGVAVKTRSLLLAMLAGVAAVALLRFVW